MASGSALGGTSLVIQILAGCFKAYDLIETAMDMPEDHRYLCVQLQIERGRLRDFTEAAGLVGTIDEDTLSPGIRTNKQLLISVLEEIKNILNQVSKPDETQPSDPYDNSAGNSPQMYDQPNLGDIYSSLVHVKTATGSKKKPPTGLVGRIKWSVANKEDFIKLLRRLRQSNNYLHELLDREQTQRLQEKHQQTVMELVQVRESVGELRSLVEAAQAFRIGSDHPMAWQQKADLVLENLAAFKAFHTTILEKTTLDSKYLKISADQIKFKDDILPSGQLQDATFVGEDGKSKRVWINWQTQPSPESDDTRSSLTPIEELTALLMAQKPDEFCVPRCLGYCDRLSDAVSKPCLVFGYPPDIDAQLAPLSLLQAFWRLPKPCLTQRIALAQRIAQCLLYLHSVNWLHKALRSENILLMPISADKYDMSSPYLTGFDYSRRALLGEGTHDVPRDGSTEVYRHPDAQVTGPSESRLYYRKTFDIYSLGIILLEIAHWRRISSIMGIEETNPSPQDTQDVQQRLLRTDPDLLRGLQGEVGEIYSDAVRFCIGGRDSFGVSRLDRETSVRTSVAIQEGFNTKVVKAFSTIAI